MPTPPPPTPKKVDFDGSVSGLSGRCPTVTFSAGGRTIVVDRSTDFKKGNCDDLRGGQEVSGSGETQSNGSIKANSINIKKGKDD
jgi:hypothetical protein